MIPSHRLFGASVFLSFAAMLAACGKSDPQNATTKPSGPPPVSVVLMPARAAELQRSVDIKGSLVGLETATISNRVAGRITKIMVDRGDRVKPSQVLLEVEPDRFKLAVEESQAALQGVLARLGVKNVPAQDFDVSQTAPVKKAQSDYDLAKEKMDRTKPLNESKTINDFEWLSVVSAYRSAESTLESSRDEARALAAQARQVQALLAQKQKDYSDSKVLAPDGTTPENTLIAGYAVAERKVSPGEYLREGTALFTLLADDVLKLQAHVPERYMADVKEGATVTFHVEAYPGEEFTGKVSTIDPMVDQASRTFMIEALVDNAKYDHRLRPGSFVPGLLLTKKEPGRIMVPLDAVTSFVGVMKVYKLDPAAKPPKVRAIEITTGQQEEVKNAAGQVTQWVEIASAKGELTAQDQVVVSGLTKLVDGSVVNIQKPQAKPEAAGAAAAKAGE
jgi:RND family efflux transporter MFP subunit